MVFTRFVVVLCFYLSITFALITSESVAEVSAQHAIAMHGEPKYSDNFNHFDYVNPKAPKGGRVVNEATGTFDSFNSFILKGIPAAGIGLIYDSLMVGSSDEAFTNYGLLAESIEVPEDRSWVTFSLHPKARWHDGKPVTPEDVIWTFETLVKKGHPFYRVYYGDVKTVRKTGDREVTFSFPESTNRELPLILGQMSILPKHYWSERDFSKTTLNPPLGSGAYRIESFEAGRSINYERVQIIGPVIYPSIGGNLILMNLDMNIIGIGMLQLKLLKVVRLICGLKTQQSDGQLNMTFLQKK